MKRPSFSLRDSRARKMQAHVKIASREKCEKWQGKEKWETTEKAQSFDFMHCSHNAWLWLALPCQSVNICQKSTGHYQHSTKSQFLSMSDKLQVCLEKIHLSDIVEEQTKEMNGLGITLVHAKPSSEDCLKDISKGKYQMMFASTEDCLCKKFTGIPKAPEPRSEYNISLIVIYECHTVETW